MEIQGRSITAYFADRNDAEEAKERLQQAGLADTQLDSVSRFDATGTDTLQNPSTGRFGSLSSLTMGADPSPPDAGALLAADPAASGYAADSTGVHEKAWMVITVTDGSDVEVERAVKILKQYGGEV